MSYHKQQAQVAPAGSRQAVPEDLTTIIATFATRVNDPSGRPSHYVSSGHGGFATRLLQTTE